MILARWRYRPESYPVDAFAVGGIDIDFPYRIENASISTRRAVGGVVPRYPVSGIRNTNIEIILLTGKILKCEDDTKLFRKVRKLNKNYKMTSLIN